MSEADAREETEALARLRRRVRRLRFALAGAGIVALVCLLAVAAVLLYWHLYLLEPQGSPFTRGPFLIRLSTSEAQFAWTLRRARGRQPQSGCPERPRAGRERVALQRPRARHALCLDGVGRRTHACRRHLHDRAFRPAHADPLRGHRRLRIRQRPRVGGRARAGRPAALVRAHRRRQQLPRRPARPARPQHLRPPARRHGERAAVGDAGRARPLRRRRRDDHPSASPPRWWQALQRPLRADPGRRAGPPGRCERPRLRAPRAGRARAERALHPRPPADPRGQPDAAAAALAITSRRSSPGTCTATSARSSAGCSSSRPGRAGRALATPAIRGRAPTPRSRC